MPEPSRSCNHSQPERGRLYCWSCGRPLWWARKRYDEIIPGPDAPPVYPPEVRKLLKEWG